MAKDKEKLFKDIDDKNITFQRAVFIVCNLKRLIKRPKKDDKHSSTGSARKRSGANAANEDESNERFEPASYAAGPSGAFGRQSGSSSRARLRFRDPVRRAFTLPAMLCSTFAVNPAATQAGQLLRQLQVPSTALQEVTQDAGLGAEDRDNEEFGGNVDDVDDADDGDENSRVSAPAANWFTRPPRLPAVAGLSPSRSAAAQAENSPSLSYLATPIRRPNNSSLHHHLRPPAPGPAAAAAGVAAAAPAQVADFIVAINSPRRQQQQQQQKICCPVWALAMRRLDALQGQPRDQQRHAHLVGPPSSLGFLVSPRQPAAAAATERPAPEARQSGCGESSRRTATTSSCSSGSAASSSCSSAGASRSSSFSGSSSCSRPSCNRSEQEQGNNEHEEDGRDNDSYDGRAGHGTRASRGKKGPPVPPPPAKYRRSSGGHETSAGQQQQQQQQQHLLSLGSGHAERPAAGALETSATSFSTQAR